MLRVEEKIIRRRPRMETFVLASRPENGVKTAC
jgi:hypothetical protein